MFADDTTLSANFEDFSRAFIEHDPNIKLENFNKWLNKLSLNLYKIKGNGWISTATMRLIFFLINFRIMFLTTKVRTVILY